MARYSVSWFDLWLAPYEALSVMRKATETASGAGSVVATRMPTLVHAMRSPWTADFAELSLMVFEKVSAFGTSSRSAGRSQRRIIGAIEGQAVAFRRLATAGWLSPIEWWEIGQRNLTIMTTLVGLPGELLIPFHKGVTVNVKRLGA